jgi:hypothetical protein
MRIKKFLNFSILAVQVRKIDTILDTANVLQDDLDENANVLVEVDHYTLKVEKLMKKGASSDQLKRNREKQAEARHKYNDIHKNAKVSLAAWVAAAPGQSIAIYNAFLNAQQQAFTRTQTLLQRLTSADVAVVTTIADKTALEAKDQTIQQQTEAKAEQQEKKPVKPLKPTFTEPLKPVTPVKPRRASTIPPPMLSVDAAIVEEEKDVIAEEPEAPQALASMESLISSTTSMKVVAESSVVVENAAAEDHNAADHATEQTSEELFIG